MARVASFAADVFTPHTDQKVKLGTRREMPDGRVFRYAQLGASNVAAARVVQSVVPSSNHVNVAVAAAVAAGAVKITLTLGATAVVANEYADGYLYINDAGADVTTEGYLYRIASHPAADASAACEFTLYNDSPVVIALTTNSEASLHHNPFRKVIIHPSPPTAQALGICPVAVTANQYFWLQTRGPAAVLTQGTLVAGDFCAPSATVDGAVMPSAAFETDGPLVGLVMSVNADGEESLVDLRLE